MSEFAKYAFNKSHAACYALVAYRTAYLKCYFPAEFMAALMTSVLDQSNKIARYTAECKRLGIRLAPADINTSMQGFTANKKIINYGLLGIKNVGKEFVDDIVKERKNGEFKDLPDFCMRLQGKHFNRRAVESLIRCGAMDCFDLNRRQMLQALPSIAANIENYRQRTQYGQVGFFELGGNDSPLEFDVPNVDEFPKAELLKMEKEMTGADRRKEILSMIRDTDTPVSGTAIGRKTGVSRQVVVQDIALLRTQGYPIISTARGYLLDEPKQAVRIFKVCHTNEQVEDELTTIVDLGGCVVNVMVNHRVYGKLDAPLNIKSRRDVQNFMDDLKTGKSTPLLNVTSGYHFHKISAESEEVLDEIEEALKKKGYLAELLPYEQ